MDITSDPFDDPDSILVRVVQVYFERRLKAEAPGVVLTLYWEDFYRVYGLMVAGILGHHFPNSADRDDATQEVWLTVASKLPEFQWRENRDGFRPWMTTLIHNKAVDLIRQKGRHPTQELPKKDQERADPDADPTRPLEKSWRREVLATVLENLRTQIGEANFSILHLHYWQDRSTAEIAAQLGFSQAQTKARLHRLLQKVRNRIAPYLNDDFGLPPPQI
jgi:RNA polymerase sigma factor (sigma-70 family)